MSPLRTVQGEATPQGGQGGTLETLCPEEREAKGLGKTGKAAASLAGCCTCAWEKAQRWTERKRGRMMGKRVVDSDTDS